MYCTYWEHNERFIIRSDIQIRISTVNAFNGVSSNFSWLFYTHDEDRIWKRIPIISSEVLSMCNAYCNYLRGRFKILKITYKVNLLWSSSSIRINYIIFSFQFCLSSRNETFACLLGYLQVLRTIKGQIIIIIITIKLLR